MDTKSPNIDGLRQLYKQNPVAKAFFDHAARRERDQSETKVDRVLVRLKADGNEFHRREIIDLFRKLQEHGCGQFVEGRRGWPSRFVWSAEMTSIGKAAAGGLQVIEHISTEEDALDQQPDDIDGAEGEPRLAGPSTGEGIVTDWYEGYESDDEGGWAGLWNWVAHPLDFGFSKGAVFAQFPALVVTLRVL